MKWQPHLRNRFVQGVNQMGPDRDYIKIKKSRFPLSSKMADIHPTRAGDKVHTTDLEEEEESRKKKGIGSR